MSLMRVNATGFSTTSLGHMARLNGKTTTSSNTGSTNNSKRILLQALHALKPQNKVRPVIGYETLSQQKSLPLYRQGSQESAY
ncbi:hypothetical protein AVEN_159488-1 [Araneus ventricosus]|uniref:Uncharacterized protein n=1 Tax=Araneus ventricosus TaxID=182803 RepID=A0A4Y2A183_ARAVE|nr:hypothetical protein AVEN_159488-1 [Araneus ventricosus]